MSPPTSTSSWQDTLAAEADPEPRLTLVPVATALRSVEVFDVSFPGFGGHPIRGWLRLPRDRGGPLPAIVQFHGYGSGRGHPIDDLLWSSAGYAHLLMDARGQGGGARRRPGRQRARLFELFDIAWFEEPLPADDLAGHVRLAQATAIPVAVGESMYSVARFGACLAAGAAGIVQPDAARLGGITPWLKAAA